VELDWSTFVLEIINFLILVWILKRFLYKPVLEAIARRKETIGKSLTAAQARHDDAQALEEQYRNRLGDWEQEKAKMRAAMLDEIEAERARRMDELQAALERERNKNQAIEARYRKDWQSKVEDEAMVQSAQFAARLLARAASPELEERLIALAREDLARLPEAQLQSLRAACREDAFKVTVASAFPLDENQRDAVGQAIEAVTGRDGGLEFVRDERLLAGLRISIGPWILRANLQDELKLFAGIARHGE
jgi:F-type H+-transporting ATPase subunit b